MFRKTIFGIAITLLIAITAHAEILRQISEAACRVVAGNQAGSGTAVFEDQDNVYVLTNAHVVSGYNTATVEFWKYGRKVPTPLSGRIVWKQQNDQYGIDFAIISIPKSSFISLPNIIQFVPSNITLQSGMYAVTAGCPRSQWLSIKEGYLRGFNSSGTIYFKPVAEDGQSGSGLFINLNGEPRIVGVITARNGKNLLKDKNGFDIYDSIALPVKNLRSVINTKSKFNFFPVSSNTQLYALGSDGKYYLQNSDGSVNVPPGTKITQWNCPGPSCPPPATTAPPGSDMIPLPRPTVPDRQPQPNIGGYGDLPPGFGGEAPIIEPEPELELELEAALAAKLELETKLAEKEQEAVELQKQIEELQQKLEELKNKNIEINTQLEEKSELIISMEATINELRQEFVNIQNNVTELNIQIEKKDQLIQEYKEKLDEIVTQPPVNIEQPKEVENKPGFWSKVWNTTKSLSPLLLLLGGAGGALLLSKWKAVPKVASVIFANRNKIATAADSTSDLFNWLKEKFDQTDAKIGAIQDYNKGKFDELDNKLQSNIQSDTSDSNDNVINNTINIDKSSESDNSSNGVHIDPHCHADPVCLDRIKQLFELKARDGESVEQWALYALLYKEAIQLLRRGKLTTDIVGNKVTLQGQRIAADKIDEWVRDQYIKRTTIEKINLDYIYHEAMLGFLYKEAVQLLRNGAFPILGAKETADAVENWVKREFLKRMGLRL